MDMRTKLILSCVGTFIGGAGMYWQQVSADDPLDARFWVSLVMAGLVPLGTYFMGLAQIAPWAHPSLPTKTVETKTTTTDPAPTSTASTKTTHSKGDPR